MTTNQYLLTLVVGGTGTTGRRVAARLAQRGVPVRIGSRRGEPRFEWDDPATWPPMLDGVHAVYVAYAPDLALPGAAEQVGAFARAAVAAGVGRLVLLSGRGEPGAEAAERAVQAAGAAWTVVRAAWFAQNFTESFLHDSVRAGTLALPAGGVVEPFVDADDIADVAVAALLGDAPAGVVYDVTGPRLLTFAQAAEAITSAGGPPVRYVPVAPPALAAALVAQGLPAADAHALAELLATVLDGRNAHLGDGVARALGRPAHDLADVVRIAVAAGAWAPASADVR